MKILIAPLNWGLGHATRCIPLIRKFLNEGHDISLGGDGDSLLLLKRTFPTLKIHTLSRLNISYSSSNSQIGAMALALPKIVFSSIKDHLILRKLLKKEHFDMIISDNRFGLFATNKAAILNPNLKQIYITHQLNIPLPHKLRLFEKTATYIHKKIYNRFDEVWIPDYYDENKRLSGILSKVTDKNTRAVYIGPLSRLSTTSAQNKQYDTVAVLSGPEPQRTIFERQLIRTFADSDSKLLIVRGQVGKPFVKTSYKNISLVPNLPDEILVSYLQGCKKIIARSGYSTIMDLATLGLLYKAELVPTPGQPEQEYLAKYHQLKSMI